jgi:hypothetical protein
VVWVALKRQLFERRKKLVMNFSLEDALGSLESGEIEGKINGKEPEDGHERKRKRKAEAEAEGSASAQKARVIVTVTIGKSRFNTKTSLWEVELKPLKGKPFWVPMSILPLEFSLWDWCFMDIDTSNYQVLSIRKKKEVEAAAAKEACKRAGAKIPGGLKSARGKLPTSTFGSVVSMLSSPLCLAPLHCSPEWLWVCKELGERVASQMSNAAAKMIFQKYHGNGDDIPRDESALIFVTWGSELFPPVPRRFDFATLHPNASIMSELSMDTIGKFRAIEKLKKHLLREGVNAEFPDSPEAPVLIGLGLLDDQRKLILHQGSEAQLEDGEFEKFCAKITLICADYNAVFPNVTAKKDDEGAVVVEVSGAHLFTDDQLINILRKSDKVTLYGLRDLVMVSEMPSEKCSTLFWRFATHFDGIMPIVPQNDLFDWAFPRFSKGFEPPLLKNQKFGDGTTYTSHDLKKPDSTLDVLKIIGFNKTVAGNSASQVVLVDHPDDYERLLKHYPETQHPGAHFNHNRWEMQAHASQSTTSTDICLFTQAFTGRVNTVFVVVRPDTQPNKVIAALNFAEANFVRILLRNPLPPEP